LFFNKDDISEKDEDDCKGRVIKYGKRLLEENILTMIIIRRIKDIMDIDIIKIVFLWSIILQNKILYFLTLI
jgi:hypothetical protein